MEDRAGHIYRVAAEIMWRRGYAATSMNEIADAVGLTKAGMYHYIRGKEDLLFKIMSFGMDMVEEDIMGPAGLELDAEDRLRTLVERHLKRIIEVGGAVTFLLEEMHALTPAHQRTIRSRKRAYFEMVRDTLQQLASERKLRDVDPTVAAFTLLGMILWTPRWYHKDGKIQPEDAFKYLSSMALNAVLRAPANAGGLPATSTVLAEKVARTQ